MSTLGIFGLQPVGLTIKSNLPVKAHRISSSESVENHFCCVLYLLPLNSSRLANEWNNYKSVVIDFTRGVVIDQARYLHDVMHSKKLGKIFGRLNNKQLKRVWHKYHYAH